MLWALMVFTFVSPDGRVFDVSEDRDQLFDFAHEHGLISRRNNLSNVYKLVDASSGSKQLNYYQPLHKLKWLKQIDKTTKQDLPRAPEPLLGGTATRVLRGQRCTNDSGHEYLQPHRPIKVAQRQV